MRSRHLIKAALAACIFSVTTGVLADQYPNKAVTVIIPFPPGGTLDVVGRMLAQKLSEQMGQSFIVDNKLDGADAILGRADPLGTPVVLRWLARVSLPEETHGP